MNNTERYNQQLNRLSTLSDDSSLGLDFIKHLVEMQTGKTVKTITPMQVLGKSADYTTDNRVFFALSLTMFPKNYTPPVVVSNNGSGSTDLGDYILTSPNGNKAKLAIDDMYQLYVVPV